MRVKFASVVLLVVILLIALPAAALAKPDGGNGSSKVRTNKVNLSSVNGSTAWGHATLKLSVKKNTLHVVVTAKNIEALMPHSAAITGFATMPSMLPTPAADTNGDGLISRSEIDAVCGAPLVWLKPFPKVTSKKALDRSCSRRGCRAARSTS